jgi:transposase
LKASKQQRQEGGADVGKTTAAKKYVAIDCHDSTLVVEAVNSGGTVEMEATVPTRAEAIRNLLEGLNAPLEIVFEEGILAQWLYEVLKPTGHRITVCDPRKNRRQGSKNDRIDTHAMVTRLRLGEISSVYHETGTVQTLKELTSVYQALVQDSVRVMQRTKSVYRARAIRCRGERVYSTGERKGWLEQLGPAARFRAELLYEELDNLKPLRQKAKTAMVQEAKRHRGYQLLLTVPFIGPIRAAMVLATLVTPWRFRTKRQLWGYAGLAVVTYSTADRQVVNGKLERSRRPPMTRGLNPNHNHTAKEIFKAMAHDGARREGVWQTFYEARLAAGMRPEMAELTLARKIAAVVLTMWKKGVPFDPEQIALPT